MPREGTKTSHLLFFVFLKSIEIKYAPGGDENTVMAFLYGCIGYIEIKYAPGGDENQYIRIFRHSSCN